MKIGIDISQSVYQTGVSDYVTNLVSVLPSVSQDLQLVLFAATLRQSAFFRNQYPSSHLFPIPPTALNILWNKYHLLNIETLIGQVDLFHSSDWTEPPSRCPKVTTLHDLSPLLFPQEMSSGGWRDITSTHRQKLSWVAKESAKIICVSQNTAADAQSLLKIDDQKLVVIPEALPARFDQDPSVDHIDSVKKKYDLKDYLVTIGTNQPRKNIKRLISAFSRYKSKYRLPDKLVIVGAKGWGSQAATDPDVIFTGFLSDLELLAILKKAQAFVFPSLYEGFGLPVLIAFRQQVPVVTSNVSSLPEVAGSAAILVDPQDEEAIASGIDTAIKNSRKLVSSGTSQLKKFSWSSTAKLTYQVYRSVCS